MRIGFLQPRKQAVPCTADLVVQQDAFAWTVAVEFFGNVDVTPLSRALVGRRVRAIFCTDGEVAVVGDVRKEREECRIDGLGVPSQGGRGVEPGRAGRGGQSQRVVFISRTGTDKVQGIEAIHIQPVRRHAVQVPSDVGGHFFKLQPVSLWQGGQAATQVRLGVCTHVACEQGKNPEGTVAPRGLQVGCVSPRHACAYAGEQPRVTLGVSLTHPHMAELKKMALAKNLCPSFQKALNSTLSAR